MAALWVELMVDKLAGKWVGNWDVMRVVVKVDMLVVEMVDK